MLELNEKDKWKDSENWEKSNQMKNKSALLIIVLLISLASFVYAAVIWSDGTRTFFTITDTNSICDNGAYWIEWIDVGGGNLVENRTPTKNDCFRPEGWPTPKCCVYGEASCDTSSLPLSPATCTGPAIEGCGAYSNRDACGEDDFNVGVATIEKKEGDGFCESHYSDNIAGVTCDWYIYDCRCLWDDATGRCNANYSKSRWNCRNESGEIVTAGNCIISTEKIDKCNTTGYINYKWAAQWVGEEEPLPEDCEPDSRKIRCAVKLTFFTIASLIAAVILIIIIYIWIKKRKGKPKIRKREIKRKKKR